MNIHHKTVGECLTGITETIPQSNRLLHGIALDSRNLRPSELFVAYPGESADGRQFIREALEKKAAAVVYEYAGAESYLQDVRTDVPLYPVLGLRDQVGEIASRFYDHPSKKLFTIGVTGTNGKTSCVQFLVEILNAANIPTGQSGTLGLGMPESLQECTNTTPDPVSLQRALSAMIESHAKAVVMEVSSHSLMQGRVNGIAFDCAIFTNLTRDHLDYHHTIEAYGEAKRRLFTLPGLRYGVINTDDDFGKILLQNCPVSVETYGYGLKDRYHQRPTIQAHDLHLHRDGFSMNLETPWGSEAFNSHLWGEFNVSNGLAVLSCLGLQGFSLKESTYYLRKVHAVPGRMERFGGDGKPMVIVDYAHTPDALEQALKAIRQHWGGGIGCVFGCGGGRDRGKRSLMGAVVHEYADWIIITNDNPRFEDPEHIVQDILQGIPDSTKVHCELDRAAAIRTAIAKSGSTDVVLIAGKGHERYQYIQGEKYPFSDRMIVEEALAC